MGCGSSDAGRAATPGAPPMQQQQMMQQNNMQGGQQMQMQQKQQMQMQTGGGEIEITYFGFGNGRAGPLQFLLTQAKAPWKKNGLTFEEWGARKSSGKHAEFGALPIVNTGKAEFDLSIPAMRRLAMTYGLYPSNDWKKAAVVDMVAETYSDVFNKWSGTLINEKMGNDEKAKIFTESMQEGGVAFKFFKVVEAQLTKNGGRFLTGNNMTFADCCMASLIYDYIKNPSGPFTGLL